MPSVTRLDRPRLLHRRGEYGYTHLAAEALPGEPEAVDAEVQRELTRRARLTERERRVAAWARTAEVIDVALDSYEQNVSDVQVADALRTTRRALARVGQRVGGA